MIGSFPPLRRLHFPGQSEESDTLLHPLLALGDLTVFAVGRIPEEQSYLSVRHAPLLHVLDEEQFVGEAVGLLPLDGQLQLGLQVLNGDLVRVLG